MMGVINVERRMVRVWLHHESLTELGHICNNGMQSCPRIQETYSYVHRKLPGDLASTFRADKITLDMISPYQAFISACDNSRSS